MGSTLIVGDGHCKWAGIVPRLDSLLANDSIEINRVIFLGDLCDEWGIAPIDMIDSLKTLVDWEHKATSSGIKVETLIGNHDLPYLLDSNDRSVEAMRVRRCAPGYQHIAAGQVKSLLESMAGLKVSTTVKAGGATWLLSHAGFTASWAETWLSLCVDPEVLEQDETITEIVDWKTACAESLSNAANQLYEDKDWDHLYAIGHARGGWRDVPPSPLWADKRELLDDPAMLYIDDDQLVLPQIVGHTPVPTVEEWIRTGEDAPSEYDVEYGAPLVFCDTMSLDSAHRKLGDGSFLLLDEDQEAGTLDNLSRVAVDGSVHKVEHQWNTKYDELQHKRGLL